MWLWVCNGILSTKGATSPENFCGNFRRYLYPKVITAVSDGASPNRKFYRLHHHLRLDQDSDCDIVYRTSNLFSPERFIWFFAYVSHLMKTDHNGLSNSGEFPDLLFDELGY